MLEAVPLFKGTSAVFLHSLALVLEPDVFTAGDVIVSKGERGREMYFVARGDVEILAEDGGVVQTLGVGSFFGETSLLLSTPRTASVRAKTQCDVYVLSKAELLKVLRDHPKVARTLLETSRARYGAGAPFDSEVVRFLDANPPQGE